MVHRRLYQWQMMPLALSLPVPFSKGPWIPKCAPRNGILGRYYRHKSHQKATRSQSREVPSVDKGQPDAESSEIQVISKKIGVSKTNGVRR